MCVILIAKDKHPTDKMVEQAWKRNDDGGGLAWREKNKAGDTIVRWHKGIESVEEMYDIMMKLPFPYVAHFRIASSGGIRPEFTHPYPVEPNVSVSLKGTTNGYVLFHNGDWKGWDDYMLKTAAGFGARIPRGKFNDTRAMAWLTHVVGDGFLEVLPTQKGFSSDPRTTKSMWVAAGPRLTTCGARMTTSGKKSMNRSSSTLSSTSSTTSTMMLRATRTLVRSAPMALAIVRTL
jgi:hypothetical protein